MWFVQRLLGQVRQPEKRWVNVDSGQLIGIIVGIVVVLAIVAVAVMISRKRKVAADRNKAAEMREQAKADEFAAREREAKAARAEADAQEAALEAERKRKEALVIKEEAHRVGSGAQEQLSKADEIDPDVVTSEQREDAARETPTRADLRSDRTAAGPASGDPGTGEHISGDQRSRDDVTRTDTTPGPDANPREDRPRNL